MAAACKTASLAPVDNVAPQPVRHAAARHEVSACVEALTTREMALSAKCLKYIVLSYAVLYGVTGAGLLCTCAYLLYLMHGVLGLVPRAVLGPPVVLAVLGVVVLLVAVLGWQSAATLHRCRLILFSTLLVLLLLAEMGTTTWSLVLRAEVLDGITLLMDQSFAARKGDKTTLGAWDSLQRKLGCCGANGPVDYRADSAVPWSCCSQDPLSSSSGDCHHVHQGGCLPKVNRFVQARLLEAALVAIASFLLQAGGVFCTCCLCNTIEHEKRRDRARHVSDQPYKL